MRDAGELLGLVGRKHAATRAGFTTAGPLWFTVTASVHHERTAFARRSSRRRRSDLKDSQRAMVAARLANMKVGHPCEQPAIELIHPIAISLEAAAEMLNVSARSVTRARKIIDEAAADVVEAERNANARCACACVAGIDLFGLAYAQVTAGSKNALRAGTAGCCVRSGKATRQDSPRFDFPKVANTWACTETCRSDMFLGNYASHDHDAEKAGR